jgi:4-alpha-glucanotransferase
MQEHPAFEKKSAGILTPVFSLKTEKDCGVGEYLDVIPFIDWMRGLGFTVFNTLPLNESVFDSGCPYTALSAFALDPTFLKLEAVEDVQASAAALKLLKAPSTQKAVAAWQKAPEVQFLPIRQFKSRVLKKAFLRFRAEEWEKDSTRAQSFRRFMKEHEGWVEDYAAFRTLKEKYDWESWRLWPEHYRRREAGAMEHLRAKSADRILFFKYLQWLCYEQWKTVQEHAARKGVWILGDLPFLVEKESADVWARQDEFSMEDTVGAPPDMFNPEGQKWGVPAYHWNQVEASDFAWWRMRLRQGTELCDLFRIDHVVGFFRMYIFPKEGVPGFIPSDEPAQMSRGERFLRVVLEEAGKGRRRAWPIAEDLGVIPDFVRETMRTLEIPGYKVLRWEKERKKEKEKEKEEEEAFIEPVNYPRLSIAVSGTHDTSPLATWWTEMRDAERLQLATMVYRRNWEGPLPAFTEDLLSRIQERLMEAGSAMTILPIQDVFGWKGQINFPGTVGSHNWTWRIPVPVRSLETETAFKSRGETVKGLIARCGRLP